MQKTANDSALQAKTYLEQSAELQKQIVSLRESRALLDQKQRTREDRATRMSFQFKSILSQMKHAQDEALIAQERNMKLLGLIPRSQSERCCDDERSSFQHAKHQITILQTGSCQTDQSDEYESTISRISADSVKIPVMNDTAKSPILITGQQRPTGKQTGTDAGRNAKIVTTEESSVCAGTMTEALSLEGNLYRTDSVESALNRPNAKSERNQGLQGLCGDSLRAVGYDEGIRISSLSAEREFLRITSKKDEAPNRTGDVTSNMSEQKNVPLKIEKSDFFSDIGDRVVADGGEVNAANTSCRFEETSRQTTYIWPQQTYPDSTQDGQPQTNDTKETSSLTLEPVQQDEAKENLRDLINSWSPEEKLAVLTTLKNTMLLWEDHVSEFGSWPEREILLNSIFAAKDSQLKLFEYLEVHEHISRPLICCGAVYELVKSYPPEKLVPPKFITDFFASDDSNNMLQQGLTFEHLEVYQEEHSHFWRMLAHHCICVKDLALGTLKEVAFVLREIFCSRDSLEELSHEACLKVRENFLHFLIEGFKGCGNGEGQKPDGSSIPLSYSFTIPVEKCLRCDAKRPEMLKTEAAQSSVRDVVVSDGLELSLLRYDFLDLDTGYRSGRSRGSKKSLFSSLGSLVRTPFKLWRCKRMSHGTESMDDGFSRLLSPKGSVLSAR